MEIVEENIIENSQDEEEENQINLLNITKGRKKARILDSDSENDEESYISKTNLQDESMITVDNLEKTIVTNNEKISNKHNNTSDMEELVEEEEEVSPHNKSFPDEETAVETVIYTTNNKGQLIQENSSTDIKKSSLSTLYDSESSEDECENDLIEETQLEEPVIKPVVYKGSRKKKKNEDTIKKMTAQEAAKQKNEIYSESLRMVRESNVSLPYHKPKSYTIKEFLEKRSKLASALPPIPKAPPSVAIKMTKDQLKEVSKKLDQRIKEVEEFYKSESDDEGDEDKDDPTEEIKGWLYSLVDDAVTKVEGESINEEIENTEASEEKQSESMEYTFNLDDVSETESPPKKSTVSELIKDKLNIQPKLSGTPDDIIDLEDGVTKPSKVKQLVEKLLKHSFQKTIHKHKVELDVIGVGSAGEIVKETVSMNVDEEEEPALVETPGAKLQKLKEELQLQMAQKRLELWKQKHEQGDVLTVERNSDGEENEEEKDILDDEDEEYELTESESEDEEDEEEEYETLKEKPKTKSAFVDDEAYDEDDEDMIDADEDEEVDNYAALVDDASENEEAEVEIPNKKALKRILKPFTEDSDEDEEQSTQEIEATKVLKYFTTDEDESLPPNLPRVGKTPQRTQVEKSKSEFDFLTPVTYLTGLQNLNSDSKFSRGTPSSPQISPTLSQLSSESNIQKNLFPEVSQNSQIEDLAQLCSGTFPETQLESEPSEKVADVPTTQELLNMCSGDFPSLGSASTNDKPIESLEIVSSDAPPTTQELLGMCSGDFSIIDATNTTQSTDKLKSNAEKEIKNLDDEHDQIISQLLDEDELERFKKKFESPVNIPARKNPILEDAEEVNATGLINSDDEDDKLEIKKRKRQKKLVFSDDEGEDNEINDEQEEDSDNEEEPIDNEEEINLHDSDDEEQQLENEIVAQESHGFKLTDFIDKEAELSESEWGSADEDEKDLDELEFEEGDEEKINEKKVRTELERIHMRQLLDEDNREVKLLQELLLEDGELHGTGRKRQFRWKTLDSADNGEFEIRDDDDIFLDEEENEEQWRKMRHKREMFLKKKPVTDDDDDSILGDSQILKVGQKILTNKSLISQNTSNTTTNNTDSSKESFSILKSKRGSFLSRNDQVLQRLAEFNKVTNSAGSTATKNSKCFVFQTVDINETVVVKDNNNKRKATENTPNVIKKLRLDDLSPGVNKKHEKSSKAKKLFGNW